MAGLKIVRPSIGLWSEQTEILVDSAGVSFCLSVCLSVFKFSSDSEKLRKLRPMVVVALQLTPGKVADAIARKLVFREGGLP
jgi:hypothetical protein